MSSTLLDLVLPRRLTAELVALLAPPACVACGAPLADAREALCGDCRRALPWLRGARCARCALPAPCAPCPAARAAFAAAWSPVAYDGPARALVLALKERGRPPAADVMAAQMAAGAPAELLGGTLVPVPADPTRRRRRGLDHAAVLASALAARLGLPLAQPLARTGRGARQLGARRADRLAGGGSSVAVRGPVPPRVLLVDDVHTTGATLDACARALRAAGSGRVDALAYARTLRR